MTDLRNVTPAGGNAAPGGSSPADDDEDKGADAAQGQQPDQGNTGDPAPSNKDRADAKAAKEAADKEAKAKAEADAAAAKDGEDDDETPDDDKELDTEVWGDPGNDEVGKSTLTLIQNSGMTPETALELFGKAREQMDPSLVDRDKLIEAVGKTKATLIMAGFETVTSREKARVAEVTKVVHDAAGGEENWKKATKWAVAKMDAAELDELRAMIDKGGRQATFAAAEIVNRYNSDPKNTALAAGKGQVTPDTKAPTTVKGITRREYGEQLDRLYRRGATEAEFNALRAQRNAGKKQGI